MAVWQYPFFLIPENVTPGEIKKIENYLHFPPLEEIHVEDLAAAIDTFIKRNHSGFYWKGNATENDDQDIRITINDKHQIIEIFVRIDLRDQEKSMVFLQNLIHVCKQYSLKFMSPECEMIPADLKLLIDHVIHHAFQ